MVQSEAKIRRYQKGDAEKILRFLKGIFGGWQSLRQWNWKFMEVEETQKRKTTIWVVEDHGRIVGHLAAVPMNLRMGSKVFPVCQLVDGGLDLDYRHRGIYSRIVQQVLSDAKEQGSALAFGFANRPSYRIYAMQGSLHKLFEIAQMFKVVGVRNTLLTAKARLVHRDLTDSSKGAEFMDFLLTLKGRAISAFFEFFRNISASLVLGALGSKIDGISLEFRAIEAAELSEQVEKLWTKLSSVFRFAFERDNNYLGWRYRKPEARYQVYVAEKAGEVVGYFVILCEEKNVNIGKLCIGGVKTGYILDLVCEPNLVTTLISAAEAELERQHASFIYCWTTVDSAVFRALRMSHYYALPNELYKIIMVASVNARDLGAIFSVDPKDILISLGDGDLA